MPEYLDIENWARRDLFEFFRGYERPHFNVCTRLDITSLLNLLRERPGVSVSLAYLYFRPSSRERNRPFHYRLKDAESWCMTSLTAARRSCCLTKVLVTAYFDLSRKFRDVLPGRRTIDKEGSG